jgi:hypothetical protein
VKSKNGRPLGPLRVTAADSIKDDNSGDTENVRFDMKMKRVLLALLPLAVLAATNAGPTVEFQSDRVQVRGMIAGERVAWAGMVREPVGHIERVRVLRGAGTVGRDGELSIPHKGMDPSRSVWLLAPLYQKEPGRSVRVAPNGEADAPTIAVTVEAQKITVESAAIDLTYVQPNGDTYYFFGADGSSIDDDHVQNGLIVLRSLQRVESEAPRFLLTAEPNAANPNPPIHVTNLQSGGQIMLLDIYEFRTGQVVVP